MNNLRNRRKRFFANNIHKEIFLLVFFAALIPVFITTILLYYLIFNITAEQVGIPEAIAYNLLPAAQRVIGILLVTTPGAIILMLIFAYQISHRIIGPYDRIIREIDENLKGTRHGPIVLRQGDKFWPLVNLINELFDQSRK